MARTRDYRKASDGTQYHVSATGQPRLGGPPRPTQQSTTTAATPSQDAASTTSQDQTTASRTKSKQDQKEEVQQQFDPLLGDGVFYPFTEILELERVGNQDFKLTITALLMEKVDSDDFELSEAANIHIDHIVDALHSDQLEYISIKQSAEVMKRFAEFSAGKTDKATAYGKQVNSILKHLKYSLDDDKCDAYEMEGGMVTAVFSQVGFRTSEEEFGHEAIQSISRAIRAFGKQEYLPNEYNLLQHLIDLKHPYDMRARIAKQKEATAKAEEEELAVAVQEAFDNSEDSDGEMVPLKPDEDLFGEGDEDEGFAEKLGAGAQTSRKRKAGVELARSDADIVENGMHRPAKSSRLTYQEELTSSLGRAPTPGSAPSPAPFRGLALPTNKSKSLAKQSIPLRDDERSGECPGEEELGSDLDDSEEEQQENAVQNETRQPVEPKETVSKFEQKYGMTKRQSKQVEKQSRQSRLVIAETQYVTAKRQRSGMIVEVRFPIPTNEQMLAKRIAARIVDDFEKEQMVAWLRLHGVKPENAKPKLQDQIYDLFEVPKFTTRHLGDNFPPGYTSVADIVKAKRQARDQVAAVSNVGKAGDLNFGLASDAVAAQPNYIPPAQLLQSPRQAPQQAARPEPDSVTGTVQIMVVPSLNERHYSPLPINTAANAKFQADMAPVQPYIPGSDPYSDLLVEKVYYGFSKDGAWSSSSQNDPTMQEVVETLMRFGNVDRFGLGQLRGFLRHYDIWNGSKHIYRQSKRTECLEFIGASPKIAFCQQLLQRAQQAGVNLRQLEAWDRQAQQGGFVQPAPQPGRYSEEFDIVDLTGDD